jgi:citrate lyase alpha subunit
MGYPKNRFGHHTSDQIADRLLLAEWTARFCSEAGLLKDGVGIQNRSGGTSLSVGLHFHEQLKANNQRRVSDLAAVHNTW